MNELMIYEPLQESFPPLCMHARYRQQLLMGKIVFLNIVFYFKIENTILFSIFQNTFKNVFWESIFKIVFNSIFDNVKILFKIVSKIIFTAHLNFSETKY